RRQAIEQGGGLVDGGGGQGDHVPAGKQSTHAVEDLAVVVDAQHAQAGERVTGVRRGRVGRIGNGGRGVAKWHGDREYAAATDTRTHAQRVIQRARDAL